jgi:hypothetical protein
VVHPSAKRAATSVGHANRPGMEEYSYYDLGGRCRLIVRRCLRISRYGALTTATFKCAVVLLRRSLSSAAVSSA